MDTRCNNDNFNMDQIINDRDYVVTMIDDNSDENQCLKSNTSNNDSSGLYIEFENLCYDVPVNKDKRKRILQNVTGYFEPGKLTAVVGPSGAGKSTLLNIISGLKSSNVKGSIKINDHGEINANTFRKQICYIPQEFTLHPLLTAKETFYFAARLKLGQGYSKMKSRSIVNKIVENLGLTECLETPVGKLSGGEKKRLSIGIEIVTKPAVLLLDEPTSGLDSSSSNQIINMLHSMSNSECTVACVVHQPSSQIISQFDTMIVMNQGTTMYCGPRENMLDTFKDAGYVCPDFYNIAEFVLEVVTDQRGGDLNNLKKINSDKYNERKSKSLLYNTSDKTNTIVNTELSETYEKNNLNEDSYREQSMCKQLQILLLRSFICIIRDNTMTKLRLAVHVIIALLLGSIFYDFGNDEDKVSSNISCIFFFLLFLFFANSMPVVQIFPTEASVFYREHLNNWYRLMPYYISKIISDLPLQLLCPTFFFAIAYYLTGQPMEWNSCMKTWVICFLHTILAQSVGIAVGAAFNTDIGTFLIPALSIPMFLSAGFFIKINEIAWFYQPLCSISFFRYAFEGIMQSIYSIDKESCTEIYCRWQLSEKILSVMGMKLVKFQTVVGILIAWICFLHVIIYSTLLWKLHCVRK
ncbi:ATP-binding cassette sub-family G member 1-like isoform X1 [Polistes fuscatus]|uniref:ATP-binding cassette sub-family G member 1-like isoform X1 n=1 Tax=Polistes fuscatus TaxID=30207 RepID=UPI001CA87930|nr:ATP-binding cassette sub-family G member 1-like isoform X1 [Polistes fuscatus]XP_043485840.1 ATP-binding cassette sub-family G member 1-like isoform X1 [Polistes fuscatus]